MGPLCCPSRQAARTRHCSRRPAPACLSPPRARRVPHDPPLGPLPQAFYMVGGIEEVQEKAAAMAKEISD